MLKFLAAPALLSLAAFWACVPLSSVAAATEATSDDAHRESDKSAPEPRVDAKHAPSETAPTQGEKTKSPRAAAAKKEPKPIKLYPAPLRNRP